MKFYIHTFGCQMNENDSEHIAGSLVASGMVPAASPEDTDLIIVNTCAVRKKSEEKLHSLLGRFEHLKKKKKLMLGVVGCVAQLRRSKLWDDKPFIDFIIGPDSYWQIPEILPAKSGERVTSTRWSSDWHETPSRHVCRKSRVSAYITIMEGCDNFCSYCVVPFTRGREKYRPLHRILDEAEDLASKGYKEIQLLGQNVNSYRDPKTGKNFSFLLRKINDIDGLEWIRFITSHPKNLTEEISETMKEAHKICHQLHLPVQSGSTSVLSRMNRGYTRKEYLEKTAFLRCMMPDIHLSTDIIVGFPDESKQEFKDTLSLLEKVRFRNIFSFRYSPRPFASAAGKADNVPFEEKKSRLIEVQALQKKIQLKANSVLIGQIQKVLCTGKSKKDPGVYSGRNEGYQVVNFESDRNVIDRFVRVKISSCGAYSLFGSAT
jgi:tRNA-2-methylthio-N6-dimethylallyladenosine synthase